MSNSKMTKDTMPTGFTMGLAMVDALPVIFFGAATVMAGVMLKCPLFLIGAALCFFGGAVKVLWKIIVVLKKKNIWWMFQQMRILMPLGFVLMIVAFVIHWNSKEGAAIRMYAMQTPIWIMLLVGVLGLTLMIVFSIVLDSADVKSNWIEQITNAVGQLAILFAVMFIFMGVTSYQAGDAAKKALKSGDFVTVTSTEKMTVFTPAENESKIGFIFYPGAQVESDAYAPLLRSLAEEGITCVSLKMPVNFALLGINGAGEAMKAVPDVETWYVGGHSLGGVSAAYYLSDHKDEISGAVFLASYSTKSLTDKRVLSIYGSLDGVLVEKQYEGSRKNFPADFTEVIIEGGNHALFGDYGFQKGDRAATITPEEQIQKTVSAMVEFMK